MADTATAPAPDTSQQTPPVAAADPETVTVNGGAPTPQPETQTPSPTAQVQPDAQQGSDARVLIPQKRGGLAGIVDDFRNAIAGTQGRGVYIDPNTGEKFVQHPTLTGKQQWLKVAGEALVGGTAGLAAGKGAGNGGKAAFAGVQAQQALIDKNRSQQDTEAEQDYSRQKAARLAKANNQLLQTQIASNEFALKRQGVKAGQDDIKFSNDQEDREKQLGSSDLGTYPDHFSLADVKKVRPEFWKDHYQDDNVVAVPSFDQNGERNGVHLYLRQPGIGDTPVGQGTKAYRFVPPSKPGEVPSLQQFTPAGTHTQREVDTYNAAAFAQQQNWQKEQQEAQLKSSETNKNKAETANAYSEASEHKAQTEALNQATGPAALQSISQGLVEGTMDPSQLSKKSKDYDAKLAAANAYSIQTTGKPFDIAKASADYKFATQKSTTDTLNFLNSLVGRDNASGNLGQIVEMSKHVGNTTFPAVNDVAQWAKLEAGNPGIAAYHAGLLEVSDQIAKILQGGGSSGTSDAKLKQAGEILDKRFNPQQIAAVANQTLRPLLATRKQEMIGDNRYLQRWHPQAQQPGQAPPGATTAYKDAQGNIKGYAVNGKYVPVQ